jgi:hypothetical protein
MYVFMYKIHSEFVGYTVFFFAFLLLSIVFHNVLIDFPIYFASKR